jgi:hypothetical protein
VSDAAVTVVSPQAFTFSHMVAGADHFCGLTEPDARLVCMRDGQVLSDDPGPYLAFDMDDTHESWSVRCAIRTSGALECNAELPFPEGEYRQVSVGAFNVCAVTVTGELVCPVPADFGGFDVLPPHVGSPFSVSQWSYCDSSVDFLHAACWDRLGNPLLPGEGHYLAVRAAPSMACAAVLAAPGGAGTGELGTSGVACFTSSEADLKAPGMFSQLDVDVNGDGCALGENGVECWGVFAGSVPHDLGTVRDLSVSRQVCVLESGGTVRCWGPTG